LLVLAFSVFAVADGWTAFGQRAEGDRLLRMQRSPNWKGGHFVNPEPLANDLWGMLTGLVEASPATRPSASIPMERIDPKRFASAPASGLRVT
jgi:hypothetical protein